MLSPDQNLIAGFLAGETGAIRQIDEWISKAASPYHRRLNTVWEDVLQSSRLEITRLLQIGNFRGESKLKTYLWRVVNSVCLNYIRRETGVETVELDAAAEKSDNFLSPLENVLARENETIALRVWTTMSEDCRHLWQMILKGMSYDEMGREKNIAAGTLRVRVLRCREKAVAVRDKILQTKVVTFD